jgi:hypothetical protein
MAFCILLFLFLMQIQSSFAQTSFFGSYHAVSVHPADAQTDFATVGLKGGVSLGILNYYSFFGQAISFHYYNHALHNLQIDGLVKHTSLRYSPGATLQSKGYRVFAGPFISWNARTVMQLSVLNPDQSGTTDINASIKNDGRNLIHTGFNFSISKEIFPKKSLILAAELWHNRVLNASNMYSIRPRTISIGLAFKP